MGMAVVRLVAFVALLLGSAYSAHAAQLACSDFTNIGTAASPMYLIDGTDPLDRAAIDSIGLQGSLAIDNNCTIRNFPETDPLDIGIINFQMPDKNTPYLIIFDNVYYPGSMSCAAITQYMAIWWVNGAYTDVKSSCQDFMLPVDGIKKENPTGQTTASVGVPFTYKLTMPQMVKLTSTGYEYQLPVTDDQELKNVNIYDDLSQIYDPNNPTSPTRGVVNYLGNTAYLSCPSQSVQSLGTLLNQGDPTHLHFYLASIPANCTVEIDLQVVLADDARNASGNTFHNTATWTFDKTINTYPQTDISGQDGTSPDMTIVGPRLVVTKNSTVTNLNKGTVAPFTISVENLGGSDAWNATIVDDLPTDMCTYDPTTWTGFGAKIVAVDGAVRSLTKGVDYTANYGSCHLSLSMVTDKAKIGPDERLIIDYGAMLDGSAPTGNTYTNIAAASQWFNDSSSNANRQSYDCTPTPYTGTESLDDCQDSYTLTSAVAGYFFLKSVEDLTTGTSPATTVFPGDTLRYTVQLQNFTYPTLDVTTITDDLAADFVAGSLSINWAGTDIPPGDVQVDPSGGTNGTGSITISNVTLAQDQQYQLQFDVTLDPANTSGTVSNQAFISGTYPNGAVTETLTKAPSDDPNANGPVALTDASGNPSMLGDPTDVTVETPVALSKTNPSPANAVVGQQFSYLIKVPATTTSVTLYDVHVFDTLPANVSYVDAHVVSGGTWNLTKVGTTTTTCTQLNCNLELYDPNTGIDIPAGGQAVIEVTVQLANTAVNQDGASFANSANYSYLRRNGDTGTQAIGGGVTTPNMTVYEPALSATKTVTNLTGTDPAAVNDTLQYTVSIPNNGDSTAFDTVVVDALPSNVSLIGSPLVKIGANTYNDYSYDTTTNTLTFGGAGTLDISKGQTLTLTYQVTVKTVDGTPIVNSATGTWTSLDGASGAERSGADCSAGVAGVNDYCFSSTQASINTLDPTTIAKAVVSDTWDTAPSTSSDKTLRVGDTVEYRLTLNLREGVTQGVTITDQLPPNLAFDGIVSINGDALAPYSTGSSGGNSVFTYADIPASAVPVVGDTSTVTWNLGDITNAVDDDPNDDTFVILYRAKVLNTILQTPTTRSLPNTVTLNYNINGTAATPKTGSASISVEQPVLSVSKNATPAIPGSNNSIAPGEQITYTVDISNTGDGPAYDPVLTDTLPVGLRQNGVTSVSLSLINAGTTAPLATIPTPTYDPSTGIATWNFDSPGYTIPKGATLELVYTVKADNSLGAGMQLNNAAQVTHYYSFDRQTPPPPPSVVSDRKDYGQTSPLAIAQLTTAAATQLTKTASVTTAALGDTFTYTITIPQTAQPTNMYDVHVTDNLASTGASLTYVGATAHLASGAKSWSTLTNSGTATDLNLSDTTSAGLDIPANDQLVVDITVELNNDTTINTPGKQFYNSANYTYDSVNGDTTTVKNGAPGATSTPITIVAPTLIMQKSGPATMRYGVPDAFKLDIQNTGASTAWDVTVKDDLPNPSPGGMCDTAPTITSVQILDSSNNVVSTLVAGAGNDYTLNFVTGTTNSTGAPTCTLTFTGLSQNAAIEAGQHLVINYQTSLDADNPPNLSLTNVAGATQWFSQDTSGSGATGQTHTYTGALTDGTVGTTDNQDASSLVTEAPVLNVTKTVKDLTTGLDPGTSAKPGDKLEYTITIRNVSSINAPSFSLTDDLGALNSAVVFVPGSMSVVSITGGGSSITNSSNPSGGTNNEGLLSLSNLALGIQGSSTDTVTVVFDVTLAPVIDSGAAVLNQGHLYSYGQLLANTDDPNVNGVDDYNVLGDEDPTRTVINSAPVMQVQKTSQDLTGDPAVLLPGDTLRYTITVKNIGSENATGVMLSDVIPNFTTYVGGSTRLNGTVVPDPTTGVSALQSGMPVNSLADPTPGVMPVGTTTSTNTVATITFDVKVNSSALTGTIISNQGFVNGSGAGSGSFASTPSDDPNTATVNDPTLNIVGSLPLLVTKKTVAISYDPNGNNAVDPGDKLTYTITVANSGAVPATGATLTDAIPNLTTYDPGTTTLNGSAVADSGGVSALQGGMAINAAGSPSGTIPNGASAVVTFTVTVAATANPGDTISNQGSVASNEVPSLLTDADGDPSNGYQPTTIVVGSAQQLSITKSVSVVGGGAALPGSKLDYAVTVTNNGAASATNVVITDDLTPLAALATYVNGSATLAHGSATTAGAYSSATSTVTADYSAAYGNLAPGDSATLHFQVLINSTAAAGATILNTARVAWNSPIVTATANASVAVNGVPGVATLAGHVWHDANYDNTYDSTELNLSGWIVDVYRNNVKLGSATTDSNGLYTLSGLAPTVSTSDQYELRFSAPGASSTTAKLGKADSTQAASPPFTDGLQDISGISAPSGSNVQNLNLPVDPDGVVYDSIRRTPIAGATLTMFKAGDTAPLPASCFNDPAQQGQVTLASGYYKFDLNFSDPSSCAAGTDYVIRVTPPPSGYIAGPSRIIPPITGDATGPYSVPSCADDAISTPTGYCEAAPSSLAPATSVPARTAATNYYLHLTLSNTSVPGDSQLFNNHIAIDPTLNDAVSITKTSARVNVSRGQLVPYTITVNNTLSVGLQNINIVDTFPPGFKYVNGSSRVDDRAVEPTKSNRQLTWNVSELNSGSQHTIKLVFIVGSGVGDGKYVNHAQVFNAVTGGAASGQADATVRVVPDPTLDCTDVIGKVFDDANQNGYQDQGEKGLPGVRVVSARGLLVTTDAYGRFHITCAVVPNQDRGSNFILKVDDRTLPTGYRLTTENPRVKRATRGKMMKFNFGAAIDKVVRIDMADGVFKPNSVEMRMQWKPRLDLLVKALMKGPAILRISYMADVEHKDLVSARLKAVKKDISRRWSQRHGPYELTIETEVFWRRGSPPD